MKTLAQLLALLCVAFGSLAHALPDTLARFPKVSGEITEIKKGELCTAVRIRLDDDTDRSGVRKLHSALQRKTYYRFKDFRKPDHDEALLLFVRNEAESLKVRDKIVVHGYAIIADLEASRRGFPTCNKIEKQ
ncbi:hypothetical protein ACFQY0_19970 [Haloferula chungangensis]|uniref:Nuclease n=1 Tax=Haloferula chungangensis TaxID=1048331 RepID=A0ABW2LEB2_9BACT